MGNKNSITIPYYSKKYQYLKLEDNKFYIP